MNLNNGKSTPVSQLPQQQQQPQHIGQFVNDQHRQIVAQAQNAAQNFAMPQTTSGGAGVLSGSTEEADIQEALALVTGAVPVTAADVGQGQGQVQTVQHQEDPEIAALRQQQAQLQAQMQAQRLQMQQQQQQQQQQQVNTSAGATSNASNASNASSPKDEPSAFSSFASYFRLPDSDEIRIALIGISAYILVTLLPVSDLLSRFVPALDGVPHADVLVRALLIGITLFVGQRAMTCC
ncbi:MAG: hypothetical protein B7Z66_14545 [Chromatiales bacterium 21-64-14]|nr:MAG: hypothetical protein B7Z66_14545 [Chromatiales bacterium 21-64-14]